jgi:hypothetical protein
MNPVPPGNQNQWYRRGWGYANRPYRGCGCGYSLLFMLLAYLVCAWLFPGVSVFPIILPFIF